MVRLRKPHGQHTSHDSPHRPRRESDEYDENDESTAPSASRLTQCVDVQSFIDLARDTAVHGTNKKGQSTLVICSMSYCDE